MKVTSANKQTDDKLLVQLQRQYGHASLILPIEQEKLCRLAMNGRWSTARMVYIRLLVNWTKVSMTPRMQGCAC
jgi:hypothetical protein